MNDKILTKNLIITPIALCDLEKETSAFHPFFEQKRLEQIVEFCKNDPENMLWHTLWQISKKGSEEPVGQLQFTKLPAGGRVEINCAFAPVKDSEKLAVEALKGMAKWAFSQNKELTYVSTWLMDDDSPAAQILENVGFIETFESDGMVHFELERPRVSLLALTMCASILLSLLPGYLFNDFPLWITIGIFAGIFPGQLLENVVLRAKRKKASISKKA